MPQPIERLSEVFSLGVVADAIGTVVLVFAITLTPLFVHELRKDPQRFRGIIWDNLVLKPLAVLFAVIILVETWGWKIVEDDK